MEKSSTRSTIGSFAVATVLAVSGLSACGSGSQPSPARTLASSIQLEPGESVTAYVSTHCGYEWLEVDVNDQRWMTQTLGSDSAGNPTEERWPTSEATDLQLTLVAESILEVTVPESGVSHQYTPGTDWPGCE